MVFVFLFLTYFTQYDNPCYCKCHYFTLSLWLSNIVYMYHTFIHSFADECLGCFHVLAIVNSAPVNIGVHGSFQIKSFLQMHAEEWDCWIIWQLCFQFFFPKDRLYYSPQRLHQFTFQPTVQEGSFSSTPSPAYIICRLFDDKGDIISFLHLWKPRLRMVDQYLCQTHA